MIEAPAIDPQLLQQTRQRIDGNLARLAKLARTEVLASRFYGELLRGVVTTLAALDGAIWTTERDGGVRIAHRISDDNEDSAERESIVLEAVKNRQSAIKRLTSIESVEETSTSGDLVLAVPIPGRQSPIGVLEIRQRGDTPRATQQGNLRFCEKAAAIAADFERARRLAVLEQNQLVAKQESEFIAAVFGNLSVKETAAHVANEARRFCDVDRVAVLLRNGSRYTVESISGAESIHRRSDAVTALRRMADRVAKFGGGKSSAVLTWSKEEEESDSSSRAHSELAAYAEKIGLANVMIVPLDGQSSVADGEPASKKKSASTKRNSKTSAANPKTAKPNTARPNAIAILEQREPPVQRERLEARVSVVREHGGRALSNAMLHENSLLLPWRRGQARSSGASRARILPRWLLFLMVLCGLVAVMVLVPANFTLEARGTLEPTIRRNVFATADGVVQRVLVQHGQQVAGGDALAELVNVDLEVEFAAKQGELAATIERQTAVRNALLNASQLHASQRDQLTGEVEQLRRTKESLQRQLQILDRKLAQNQILSPIDGEVVTWNVAELLSHRPVRQGQKLLTVANPSGEWELELQLPESRLGHLLEAQRQANSEENNSEDVSMQDVVVEFILATEPGVTYQGRIKEIHRRAELAGADGNAVLVKVAVNRDELEQLHPGASVVAKFHCGQRPLGYVLFRDVVEFAQRSVLFRF